MELATQHVTPNRGGNRWWKMEDREPRLQHLVELKVPYPDIAGRLGTSTGAICGKVSRMGIGKGPLAKPTFVKPAVRTPVALEADSDHAHIIARQQAEASTRHGVQLEDLEEHHCRFVLGEPAEMRFCGAPKARWEGKKRSAYCPFHDKRCRSIVGVDTRDRIAAAVPATVRAGFAQRHNNWTPPQHRFVVDVRSLEVTDDRPHFASPT